MFVKMEENIGTAEGGFTSGTIYDVAAEIGRNWTRVGHAVETTDPPEEIARLFARLEEGAGQPCIFMPFVGEFGHLIMSHARIIHFHKASEKIVCCRPGQEVLFPSAAGFFTAWPEIIRDAQRIATCRHRIFDWPLIEKEFPGYRPLRSGGLTPAQEIFPIEPATRIPFRPKVRGIKADVVIATRLRSFCMERNWPHWQHVAYALRHAGLTYAVIGDKATSFDLDGSEHYSGDMDTDAAIELLQNCRLYLGTDTGPSHLAATIGARMAVFRESKSGSRDLFPRMEAVNPGRITIIRGGWSNPACVIAEVMDRLERQA